MHPIQLAVFVLEIIGVLAGVAVAVGLLAAESPRSLFAADRREAHRFGLAVGDIVGRTRSIDLNRDVRCLGRYFRDQRRRTPADVAVAAVLVDGPRRLGLVVALTIALLLGVAPMPLPPAWAVGAAVAGVIGMSAGHVLLAGGRIRFGDRIRWSYAALGEVFSRSDRDDLAPRAWVGTVAAVVVVNLAIALRGMSDRWTHGLTPMTNDDRLVTMALAIVLVVGALYTLHTSTQPELANAHLVSRRLEERTARQSAVGAAVCVGLIGLLAGVLPGTVDAADDTSDSVVQIDDRERRWLDPVEGVAGD
jgi:hypothetical protein